MNILICYMPKTELRMRSYDAMNKSKKIRVSGKKSTVSDPDLDPAGADPEVRRIYCSPEVAGDGGGGRSSP